MFGKEVNQPGTLRRDKNWLNRLTIVGARLQNRRGNTVEVVASGDLVRFVVDVQNNTGDVVSNLKVSIFLYTAEGTHLADLGIWESGSRPFSVADRARVSVEVPRLPLNRGQYRYSVVVRSAIGAGEIDDMIENIGRFTVDFGDFHGIGSSTGGLVSIEHAATVTEFETTSPLKETT